MKLTTDYIGRSYIPSTLGTLDNFVCSRSGDVIRSNGLSVDRCQITVRRLYHRGPARTRGLLTTSVVYKLRNRGDRTLQCVRRTDHLPKDMLTVGYRTQFGRRHCKLKLRRAGSPKDGVNRLSSMQEDPSSLRGLTVPEPYLFTSALW